MAIREKNLAIRSTFSSVSDQYHKEEFFRGSDIPLLQARYDVSPKYSANSRHNPHPFTIRNPFDARLQRLVREELAAIRKSDSSNDVDNISSLIPGFRNIVSKSRFIVCQIIWVAIIFFCTIIFIYQATDRVMYYFSYPVKTVLTTTSMNEVSFPNIILCSNNNLKLLKIKLEIKQDGARTDDKLCPTLLYNLLDQYSTDELWEASYSENDFTISITENVGDSAVTGSKAYTHVHHVDSPIGRCMEIKTIGNVSYSGHNTKLEFRRNPPLNKCTASNLMFMIKRPGDLINIRSVGFTSEMANVDVAIYMKKFNRLNTRSKPCISELESKKCYFNCLSKKFSALNFTCTLPYLRGYISNRIPPCNSSKTGEPTHSKAWELIMKTDRSEDCGCPIICTEIMYSISRFPISISTNETVLSLFYPTNQLDVISEEYAYDFIALLGSIGGNLGLYLGLSVVSFCELFESLWQICRRKK